MAIFTLIIEGLRTKKPLVQSKNDYSRPVLQLRQGDWKQVGQVPAAAAAGQERGRGHGRPRADALLLPQNGAYARGLD